jgi:hypothetical protein
MDVPGVGMGTGEETSEFSHVRTCFPSESTDVPTELGLGTGNSEMGTIVLC